MTNGANLDLSESYIYSTCCSYGCGSNAASITRTLNFFISDGVIDDNSLSFPTTPTDLVNNCYFRNTCYKKQLIIGENSSIPPISPSTNASVKRAIMDHGPLIAQLNNSFGCVYHNSPCTGISHTVLVGWQPGISNIKWQTKDSWPGDSSLNYREFDIFYYNPTFYYIIPDTLGAEMSCDSYNGRTPVDHDEDGFYNWGIGPKPSSLTNAPNEMDYNDDDASIISLTEHYNPSAPNITWTADPVCSSGGTFKLDSLPSGFTVTWSVNPSNYFTGSTSGNGDSAFVTPLSTEIMKPCYITFTIHETGTSWTKQYVKNFIINGPDPSQISTSVEDSYGHTPLR